MRGERLPTLLYDDVFGAQAAMREAKPGLRHEDALIACDIGDESSERSIEAATCPPHFKTIDR